MSGVYKLEIHQSEDNLKQLRRQHGIFWGNNSSKKMPQKTASEKEGIQLLYLLKSRQVKTVQDAVPILGRNRVTLQKWLRGDRSGGLARLLEKKVRSGRPRAIPGWAEAALKKRLQDVQGFDGYQAICDWLFTQFGIQAADKTVYQLVMCIIDGNPHQRCRVL